jgi:Flp pilus assembly protein TadG
MVRKLLREERGSTALLLAVAMVMMMLMAGLVIDVGYLYLQKTIAQTGVDAAVLAGAAKLPDQAAAKDNADRYATLNRLDTAGLTPDFSKGAARLDLAYSKEFDTFFMRLLRLLDPGSTGKATVKVAAAAQLAGPGRAFDFTIFSGSLLDILPLSGSRLYVDGSVHSNDSLRVNGSNITITGAAEAVDQVIVNGSSIVIGSQAAGAAYVAMPDYSSQIEEQAAGANQVYSGDKTFNAGLITVNNSIHVNGAVTLNGNSISGAGAILASGTGGDIYINGNIISATADDQVALYSQNGSIHVNGNGITIDGILYAPNGDIHINGNNIIINGRVIANTVQINGSNLKIYGKDIAVTSLPSGGVKLVQ